LVSPGKSLCKSSRVSYTGRYPIDISLDVSIDIGYGKLEDSLKSHDCTLITTNIVKRGFLSPLPPLLHLLFIWLLGWSLFLLTHDITPF